MHFLQALFSLRCPLFKRYRHLWPTVFPKTTFFFTYFRHSIACLGWPINASQES